MAFIDQYTKVWDNMQTKPSAADAEAQNLFLAKLVDKGIFQKLDFLYVFAVHTNSNGESLVNWRSPGTFNASEVNSPSFTAYQGYTSDGSSSRIDSNFIPSSDGDSWTLNDASFGLYIRTDLRETNTAVMGCEDGSNDVFLQFESTNGLNYVKFHTGANFNYTPSAASPRGLWSISRVSSSEVNVYRNSELEHQETGFSSVALPSVQIRICDREGFETENEISMAFGGSSLTADEVAFLNDAFETYMTSLGTEAELEPEYIAILEAMTTVPSAAVQKIQNTFVKRLKAAGFWSRMDFLHVYATEYNSAGEALINWLNPGTFDGTEVNSPVWTSKEGYLGDGSSSYISTGYNASTSAINFALNSGTLGLYYRNNSTITSNGYMGQSNNLEIIPFYSGAYSITRINGGTVFTARETQVGTFFGTRTASNLMLSYAHGLNIADDTDSSVSIPNGDVNVLKSGGEYVDVEASVAFVMDGISSTDALNLHNIICLYIDSLETGVYDETTIAASSNGSSSSSANLVDKPVQRFWVGETGNWSDTANWSDSSGGSGGSSVPTSSDNVVFDENSFTADSQTVTLNVAATCRDLDMSAVDRPANFAMSSTLNCYGSLILGSNITKSGSSYIYLQGSDFHYINFYDNTCQRTYLQGSGKYTLLGDFEAGGSNDPLLIEDGIFDCNGYDLQFSFFSVSPGAVFYGGSGTLTLTGSNSLVGDAIRMSGVCYLDETNFVLNRSGGGDINVYDSQVIHSIEFLTAQTYVLNGCIIDELTLYPGMTLTLYAGDTVTINTSFSAIGSSGNEITIQGNAATSYLDFDGAGVIGMDYCDFSYITASPDNTWYAGDNSTDSGNNIGVIFTENPGRVSGRTDLGSELVTDGDFSSDANWSLGSGWSISGGQLVANGAIGYVDNDPLSVPEEVECRIEFDMLSYTEGSLLVSAAAPNVNVIEGVGHHFYDFDSDTGTRGDIFYANNALTAIIDNISIKQYVKTEVSGTLTAKGILKGSNIIADDFEGYTVDETLSGKGGWLIGSSGEFDVVEVSGANAVKGNTDFAEAVVKRSESFSNDQFAEATIAAIERNTDIGVAVRITGSDSELTFAFGLYCNNDQRKVFYLRNNGWSSIGNSSTGVSVGDKIGLAIRGSKLRIYYNGELDTDQSGGAEIDVSSIITTYPDLAGGVPGISGYSEGISAIADWRGGDLISVVEGTLTEAAGGTSSIAGSSSGAASVSGNLIGEGELEGLSEGLSTLSGILNLQGSLSGQCSSNSSLTAELIAFGELISQSNGISTLTGELLSDSTITASSSGSSTLSAELIATGKLECVSTGLTVIIGTLNSEGLLSGQCLGNSGVTAELGAYRELIGQTNGVSTISGLLFSDTTLSGTSSSTSILSGVITANGSLEGISESIISVSATISSVHGISGSSICISTTGGTISSTGELAGQISGPTSVTGELVLPSGSAVASSSGISTLTGILVASGELGTSTICTSIISADLQGKTSLEASSNGDSIVEANILAFRFAIGSIICSAILSGELFGDGELESTSEGNSIITGNVQAIGILHGSSQGLSTVVCSISATIPISGLIECISIIIGRLTVTEIIILPDGTFVTSITDIPIFNISDNNIEGFNVKKRSL